MIHYTHTLKISNTDRNIIIAKYYVKLAYRIGSFSGKFATMCMPVVSGIALLSSRITFGESFYPFTWFLSMDITHDLANDLLQ